LRVGANESRKALEQNQEAEEQESMRTGEQDSRTVGELVSIERTKG